MLCRICMDRSLDTALFPCGHAVACLDCARRCERCPLCRADIDHCRTIYLPIELTHIDRHSPKLLPETIEPVFAVKSSSDEIKGRIVENEINENHVWGRSTKVKFKRIEEGHLSTINRWKILLNLSLSFVVFQKKKRRRKVLRPVCLRQFLSCILKI